MENFVLSTKPSKNKLIKEFMNSRNIIHIFLHDSQELYDALLTGTCNLHIFDYHLDMSILNTLRDLRDNANNITVFVTCVEHAQPYLALTDDVFILPDEFNIMSYFWDSDACNARNVMAFDLSNQSFFLFNRPESVGKTKHLAVDIGTRDTVLRYKTNDGRIVQKKSPQLIISCKAKTLDLTRVIKTRDQSEVFNRRKRDLGDLPAATVDPPELDIVEAKPEPKVKAKPEKAPDYTKAGADERGTGIGAIFAKIRKPAPKPELEPEPELEPVAEAEPEIIEEPVQVEEPALVEKPEPVPVPKPKKEKEPDAPVSFAGFSGGNVARNSNVRRRKITISTACETIASYCLENQFISHEEHDSLMMRVRAEGTQMLDTRFGDAALAEGLITEEQLIKAISSVNGIEVLPWSTVEAMEVDFSFFTLERCKEFKFFVLQDTSESDTVQLIASASISALNSEVKRLFDHPRIRYTLDTFITRKLEAYS